MRPLACLISSHNEKPYWVVNVFFVFCNANFDSWENFLPEESKWFYKNHTEVFAQVCLSAMLIHSSFRTGKTSWKEFLYWISLEMFVQRKYSGWEACWQEHCCWAVCLSSQEEMFSKKQLENLSERIPGNKISGKNPLQENSNSHHLGKLGFQAHLRFGNSLKRLCWKAFWQAVSVIIFLVCPLHGCKKFRLEKNGVVSFSFKEMVRASLAALNLPYRQGYL